MDDDMQENNGAGGEVSSSSVKSDVVVSTISSTSISMTASASSSSITPAPSTSGNKPPFYKCLEKRSLSIAIYRLKDLKRLL